MGREERMYVWKENGSEPRCCPFGTKSQSLEGDSPCLSEGGVVHVA